jgi:eukaryotic-like serine/threonine-protein kinase
MNTQVKLTVANDDHEMATYHFDDAQECYVGSSSSCDIQLPVVAGQRNVARQHCVFQIEPPVIWLRILDPKNRTYINDLSMTSTDDDPLIELRDGDEVEIGPYTLSVQVADENVYGTILAGHAASDWNV